jgi:hypothetical protein
MVMARLAGALLALALVAACAAVHPPAASQSPAGGVIPWLPLEPKLIAPPASSPSPIPVPPGTPACTADRLQGGWTGVNGATGHFFTYLAVSGLGPGQCYLQGAPSVTVVDKAGQVLAIGQRTLYGGFAHSDPALVDPGPLPSRDSALKFGQAGLSIDWVTQPEACPGTQGLQVQKARIAIPGSGVLEIPIPTEPAAYACQGLGVGYFEGPYIGVAPAEPAVPSIRLEAPDKAVAGRDLEYLVTLTNDTTQPIDLVALCPTFEEELFADLVNGSPPLGGKHIYALNCAPAGTIKPGASRTFQMVYRVTPDATPGTYTLVFMLGHWNAMTRDARHDVTVG